jgi:hypothetical protein
LGEKFPLRLMRVVRPVDRVVRPVDGRGRVVLPGDLLEGWRCLGVLGRGGEQPRSVVLYLGAFAALVAPEGADLERVIRSAEILLEELRSQAGV